MKLILGMLVGLIVMAAPKEFKTVSAESFEVLPGQTIKIPFGDYVVSLQSTAGEVKNGEALFQKSGNSTTNIIAPKFYGSVRYMDFDVRDQRGKRIKEPPEVREWLEVINTNLQLPQSARHQLRTVQVSKDGTWFGIVALGDRTPLPGVAFTESLQRLYIGGKQFASFRIYTSPTEVKVFWEPTSALPLPTE